MSFFVRKDTRWQHCADPAPATAVWLQLRRYTMAIALVVSACAIWYATNVYLGLRTAPITSGTLGGLQVAAETMIDRDARGVPHIRAATMHDLFFAQGFAQASDRFFQMELTRRYGYGKLAEIFGERALPIDENMRALDVASIVERQWRFADPPTRLALQAFADGVNAALERQPLPVEFRMLLYSPARWIPQDSLAVSVVAAFELSDSWQNVFARDAQWHHLGEACYDRAFPLSDTRYDVTFDGRHSEVQRPATTSPCGSLAKALPVPQKIGSNAWAAAATRTHSRRALLANDPHVDLTIPGIWYLMDLRAPGFHVAGAALPGLPGIVLGHNEHVAWGATNAEVATTALYRVPSKHDMHARLEAFHVRFSRDAFKTYYQTATEYSVGDNGAGMPIALVRWPPQSQNQSGIQAILALDAAGSIADSIQVLARYTGAPENFVLADTSGAIAYRLAGAIPDDRAWGRYMHDASDLPKPMNAVPFNALPQSTVTSNGILVSANNRMYGKRYTRRLSAQFEWPYRAYRIAQLLNAKRNYDAAYFASMQLDTYSPIEAEVARAVGALRDWDGRFEPTSTSATRAHELLSDIEGSEHSFGLVLDAVRNARTASGFLASQHASVPWSRAGAVDMPHPLSPMWYGLLGGGTLPGDGDEFTIHLQEPGFAQGMRAVWDVGNWDAAGVSIPAGESGVPASMHYTDRTAAWIKGVLEPLPFSEQAVKRATVERLRLLP